jgi:hypothetical protein
MSQKLRNCLKHLEFISKIKDRKTQKNLLKYISNYPKYYMALKEIERYKRNVIAFIKL